MARVRSPKAQALDDYIEELERRYPAVHAEEMQSSSGTADYWIRVETPESLLSEVEDITSTLSYDWHVERGVDILASVRCRSEAEESRDGKAHT